MSEDATASGALEETVRRFVADVWNGGREESAHEFVAPQCPGLGQPGPAGTIAWHRDRRESFPDLRYEIVDLVVGADRAALRWRAAGTQNGTFGPISWFRLTLASTPVFAFDSCLVPVGFTATKIGDGRLWWSERVELLERRLERQVGQPNRYAARHRRAGRGRAYWS